jgi:ESS family glutamate:Na+ symporter
MATWGQAGILAFAYVPLFPFAAVGGLVVQLAIERGNLNALVSRSFQERIGGVALDGVIITAFAVISLQTLRGSWLPLGILALAGIIWNVGAFLYFAPRMLPEYWFARGLGDLGQSMGVTATGILLIQMVDPQHRTGALESFSYKQLLFAPIVGGGVVTATMPALIVQFGPWPLFWVMLGFLVIWIIWGLTLCRQFSGTHDSL